MIMYRHTYLNTSFYRLHQVNEMMPSTRSSSNKKRKVDNLPIIISWNHTELAPRKKKASMMEIYVVRK